MIVSDKQLENKAKYIVAIQITHKLGERQGQRLNWTESGQTQRVLKEVTFIVLKTRERWNRTKKLRVGK